MNRNHYMAIGTVVLLFGLTLYRLENVTLTMEATTVIAQQLEEVPEGGVVSPSSKRTITIPAWVCFSTISLGAILMLHAIGMGKS